jgi:hypothetical protein
MTPKHLEALKRGKYGRAQGFVDKLIGEIEGLMHRVLDLEQELNAERLKGAEREIARPDPERVLVAIEEDGWIECWHEPHVNVRILYLPKMSHRAAAELAERHLISRLPLPYKELMDDYPSRTRGNVQSCPNYASLKLLEHTLESLEYAKNLEEAIKDTQHGTQPAA